MIMVALFSSLILGIGLPAAPAVEVDPLPQLKSRLDAMCSYFRGRAGYSLKMLDSGRQISYRGDERFPTASTIKTAVMLHVIREVEAGRMKWTDKRELPPKSKRLEWDTSVYSYYLQDGLSLDLDGYVNLMISVSDNLATRVLREWLGTVNVNRSLTDLGFKDTLLLASAPKEETRLRRLGGQFGMGMTTPNEMNRMLEMFYRGTATSKAGSEKILRILQKQYWDDWIGVSVPPGVTAAMKSGAISRSRSDTAIVFAEKPYVLTIYTDSQKDQRWTTDNDGDTLLRQIAVLVWNSTQKRKYSPPKGSEKYLPTGGGLEGT